MEKKKDNPLFVEAERQRFEFLKAELELAFTFIRIAQTEYSSPSDPAHAKRATTKAREAYNVILNHLPTIKITQQERQWFNEKMQELEQAFAELPKSNGEN